MNAPLLRRVTPDELVRTHRTALDAVALSIAQRIIADVDARGRDAVIEHAERLGDLSSGDPLIYSGAQLRAALEKLDVSTRRVLESAAENIRLFAQAQRVAMTDVDIAASRVAGCRIGHRLVPMSTAGCYAPGGGGRYPLPSTILMTAITARVAGVRSVCVASSRPTAITLAAAAIAGVDHLLAVGGAQAIAALVAGVDTLPPCDVVVGPGNKYVTAAKHAVCHRVRIDMLAGPSEVLVIADESADPRLVAADLLAQAEHDDDAAPQLISTSEQLIARVEEELAAQLETLPTAATSRRALRNGFACFAPSLEVAARLSDRLAPEHLQLMTKHDDALVPLVRNYGALFIGSRTAETLGDYGVGPNHTLPTGGAARFSSGLSVLTFLNTRTWIRFDERADDYAYHDAAAFARLEGLEAHARAALARTVR